MSKNREKVSVCLGNFFQCENTCFLRAFLFPCSRCMPDVQAGRGYGCEVRTILGRPQQFESIGICVTSLAQESEVRVPLGSGSW